MNPQQFVPRSTNKELIRTLAERVRESPFFKGRTDDRNHQLLLDLFVNKYPAPTLDGDIRAHLDRQGTITGEVTRLADRLVTTFRKDRSLWPSQQALFVRSEKNGRSLDIGYLSSVLPATWQFWFPQCVRLGAQTKEEERQRQEASNHFIIFSEPLFFFSKSLRAYVRLLDVNYEDSNDEERNDVHSNDHLVANAKDRIRGKIPRALHSQIDRLDLTPVRHYVASGDAYSASEIRGWFRSAMKEMGSSFAQPPEYREASQVAPADYMKNLIIVGSRRSLKLLSEFQRDALGLEVLLTESGIELRGKSTNDEYDATGFTLSYVIVTMWTFDENHVHTYIVSNHTRATHAVTRLLQDEEQMREICGRIRRDGKIPGRFQIAFKVPLTHDRHALKPSVLDTFIY